MLVEKTINVIDADASTPEQEPLPEELLQEWLHLKQEHVTPEELADDFLANPNKYHPALHSYIANLLIKYNLDITVTKNLDKFSSLDAATANNLLSAGQIHDSIIIQNREKFVGLTEMDLLKLLIKHQHTDSIYHHLDQFKETSIWQIIDLTRDSGYLYLLPDYIKDFPSIFTPEVILMLIEKEGLAAGVSDELSKLDHKLPAKIAYALIDRGLYSDSIYKELDKFEGLDMNRIVTMLLNSDPTTYEGAWEIWDAGLKLDQLTIPLEPDQIDHVKFSLEHLYGLGADDSPTLEDKADYFLENLHKYADHPLAPEYLRQALKYYSVAKKWQEIYAIDYTNKPWHTQITTVAEATLANGPPPVEEDYWDGGDDLGEGSYAGPNTQGYSLQDRYKDDPNYLRGEKRKQANQLYKYLNGEPIHAEEPEELQLLLNELNHFIEIQLGDLKNRLENYRFMSDEDKLGIVAPEKLNFVVTPFEQSIKRLIARYIVQTTNLLEFDWKGTALQAHLLLNEGLSLFLDVYEKEIPLYDKLYEEFDEYRKDGRMPMEVYLGRDGIYAWLGRRAQDTARRRNLAPGERVTQTKNGEILEIHPHYLVYPRRFRDALDPEVKAQYLKAHNITAENDPFFYDTGYTGTIPEDIMRVMGFGPDEIEQRIKLLSANRANRRVKGISENARSDIVEFIEYNPKLEHPAEGLTMDEKSGKIRHIAQPTSPKDQFKFGMIRQAIVRHYWLQERLHHSFNDGVKERRDMATVS